MDQPDSPSAATPANEPPHDSQAEVRQEPRERRHGARRTAVVVATTSLVAGALGVGGGYLAGHGLGGGAAGTAQSSTQRNATYGGSGSSGGSHAIPGNPGWRWSTGRGRLQVPTDPFGSGQDPFDPFGSQRGGSGGSSASTSRASAKQLTGLVRIVSTMKYAGGKAAGTGMVLTSDGEVVTNHHVVEGATSVRATVMSTGRTYVAKVVGTDAKDDVAVLQLVGATGLSTVTPDTSGLSVGDKVTAVGDANGAPGHLSAAGGKVLALRRSITTQSEATASGERLTGLVEISSDVVSGDSGGATYDSDGRVVGMTTAASSGGDIDGYAVPIAKVVRVADDLENGVSSTRYEYGRPAFLGVGLDGSTTQLQGVYAGTPAAAAGLAAGDRITAVDGTTVRTSKQLRAAIASHSPGDGVRLTWTSPSGSSQTATLTLGTGPVA